MKMSYALSALSLLWLAGCGNDVSSPVPQPVPDLIRTSTPGLTSASTLIVGLPRSVAGAGRAHVRDQISAKETSASSSVAGTFSAVLEVGPDASLEAWFENEDGKSGAVWLSARAQGAAPGFNYNHLKNGLVSAPDAQGLVTVSNEVRPTLPTCNVTPNCSVVVSNGANAAVATTSADGDGCFTVQLPGAKGDEIRVLLVNPEDPFATSDYLTGDVP